MEKQQQEENCKHTLFDIQVIEYKICSNLSGKYWSQPSMKDR
jgi:hypothetical protein